MKNTKQKFEPKTVTKITNIVTAVKVLYPNMTPTKDCKH